MPLRLETGRYSIPRVPEAQRTCLVCDSNTVECEIHYLFSCSAYSIDRDEWYRKMTLPNDFEQFSTDNKLKVVLNDQSNVKLTARFIVKAYHTRSKLLNINLP